MNLNLLTEFQYLIQYLYAAINQLTSHALTAEHFSRTALHGVNTHFT